MTFVPDLTEQEAEEILVALGFRFHQKSIIGTGRQIEIGELGDKLATYFYEKFGWDNPNVFRSHLTPGRVITVKTPVPYQNS